jgi:hypothetical protein
MKKTRYIILLFILIFFLPVCLNAADFGFLINQYAKFADDGGDKKSFEYKAGFVPRLSFLVGDTGSFFASASFTLKYNEELKYIPELLRTEFSTRFNSWGINIGRFSYSDPLSFVSEGLFDGIRLSYSSSVGRFGLGAWYTGLLYKDTTVFNMTMEDEMKNAAPLDFKDFSNTYFAPRRMLASLEWEHPAIAEILRTKFAVIGQFDLTDIESKLNTQYFVLKLALPVKSFLFEAGGTLETIQADSKSYMAFAGEAGISWTLPASFNSRILLTGRYSSGRISDSITAFIPVTTKYYADIFQAKMTGISIVTLNYSARFLESLGVSLAASYFIRNDLVTANSYPVADADEGGYYLGAEVFIRFIWSPVSDLQFNLGGGAFVPSLGDNWPEAKPVWKVELTAVLAVF